MKNADELDGSAANAASRHAPGGRYFAATALVATPPSAVIGTLGNDGGGRYRGDLAWSVNPQNVTVRGRHGDRQCHGAARARASTCSTRLAVSYSAI